EPGGETPLLAQPVVLGAQDGVLAPEALVLAVDAHRAAEAGQGDLCGIQHRAEHHVMEHALAARIEREEDAGEDEDEQERKNAVPNRKSLAQPPEDVHRNDAPEEFVKGVLFMKRIRSLGEKNLGRGGKKAGGREE